MARYTGPKNKLSRREGVDLFGKGQKLRRKEIIPGQHGQKRRGRITEYGRQLREKQKTKRLYGILEKQFVRYVSQARKSRENTEEILLSLLERRLDNTVYRLGFAKTRPAARQLVSHEHIRVNDHKVNIPSYQLKEGDLVALAPKAAKITVVARLLKDAEKPPAWLERKAGVGKIKRLPIAADVPEPISVADIVGFYSR